jgi:iron(III) transport system permease protein
LGDYLKNSMALCFGVGVASLALALPPAWLTARYRFPGQRLAVSALLLPLAIPAYLIAYTYTGLLDVGGPVQAALRSAFGLTYGHYWFPEVRSLTGAMVMLSLVLHPYIYLLARTAFLELAPECLEAAATLGAGPVRTFFRVVLPLSRPAVAAGLALVLMETLADFGTVQYFGVPTLTTGIYRTWFSLGDEGAAAQLSALALVLALMLLGAERAARRQARFYGRPGGVGRHTPKRLHGMAAALAAFVCAVPVVFGFALPATVLALAASSAAPGAFTADFLTLAGHSLALAAIASLIITALAVLLTYCARLAPHAGAHLAVSLASMGYAVPGTVIAVGTLLPFTWLDRTLSPWLYSQFGVSGGMLLTGTIAALLFAYAVRFMAVALGSVAAGLARIRPSMDEAGRSLGLGPPTLLTRIHLPLLRGSLFTALLLVFVDVLKELPATLLLRPFNYNTLAIRAYDLANEERLADAALPALAIVLVGILPVVLLSRAPRIC